MVFILFVFCYLTLKFDSHDLYYYRARYYDPTLGRFISSDPIEFLAGDFNFYRYVGNDPVNFVDPSGLTSDCTEATRNGTVNGAILYWVRCNSCWSL